MALIVHPAFQQPQQRVDWDPFLDLRLRVLIPLERLFRPLPQLEPFDLNTYRPLASYAETPLRFFEPSRDIQLMEQIVALGKSLSPGRGRSLITLSRYFEALSVQYGSLSQRHWNLDEDKMTANGWSMIGYFFHCQEWLQSKHPQLCEELSGQLIAAFSSDLPFFEKVFEYEKIREQIHFLKMKLVELKIRKFYELRYEDRNDIELFGMCSFANYSECQQLSNLKKRKIYSSEEKRRKAEEIWDTLAADSPLRMQVEAAEEVESLAQTIAQLENRLPPLEQRVQSQAGRLKLNEPKRALQALFEYHQLSTAIEATQNLSQQGQEIGREGMIQWLILLREGLKVMATDTALNIPELQSVKWISGKIKDIRDYYEHPEDYALRLDRPDRKATQFAVLESALFKDLLGMHALILKLLSKRKEKLNRFLTPHPEIDPSDALKTLTERKESASSKREPPLLDQNEGLRDFQSRIVDLRDFKKADSLPPTFYFEQRENREEKALEHLVKSCRKILEGVPNDRFLFLDRLENDLAFRLKVQWRIAKAVHQLKQVIRKQVYPKTSPYLPGHLERIYEMARDNRNLSTHEIWRVNPKGIADAAYLLGSDCLTQLTTPRFVSNAFHEHVIQDVVWGRLKKKTLMEYLDEGFDPNYRDHKGRTILHFLAIHQCGKNLDLFMTLVKMGASIHVADYEGMRPLHYAAESNFFLLARYLVQIGAVVDAPSSKGSPTEVAETYENREMATFLAECRGENRSANARAMKEAIGRLDVEKVEILLEEGFDAGAEYEGWLPLVYLFSMQDADPDRQLEIADLLIAAGADLNQGELGSGETPLIAAVRYTENRRIRRWFLRQNLDCNRANSRGNTALHMAARCRRVFWTKELLARGAAPNAKSKSGDTPLLDATNGNYQSSEMISALLDAGANPDEEGEYGTALHGAAECGTLGGVRQLLKKGASPFLLGRAGLYYDQFPSNLATGMTKEAIDSVMCYLFGHLSQVDQTRLRMRR